MATKTNREFWVTNISKKNVSLRDLRLTIPALTHMNLLDSRHFHYNLEQLENSKKSGSLYKKSHMIKVREVPPGLPPVKPGIYVSKTPLYMAENPDLSRIVIKEEYYKELDVSDEEFAEEMTTDEE